MADSGTAPFAPPSGTITLRDALVAALRGSPALPASQAELRAREAETIQAGLRPNPSLTTEVEDFSGSGQRNGFNASQTTVSLAQLVELGGKRAARVRLAEANEDIARWDYETLRLSVLTAVARAFLDVLAAQGRLTLSDDLLRLAEQSLSAVATTVRAGAVSPVEEGRARVVLSQVTIERELRARALEEARLSLAATWGSKTPTFSSVAGDFPEISEPPPLDTLLAQIENNPDLARWRTELEEREATLELERSRAVPDLTVSAGGRYYQDQQDGGLVALFSVPLPVFDRNQGRIAAAEERVGRARFERAATEVSLATSLARVHRDLVSRYRQARLLRDRAIPEAERVFAGARDAYHRGLFRYIEVLDAQRTLFQLRADYVEALSLYHEGAQEIARLIGTEPTSRVSVPGGESR